MRLAVMVRDAVSAMGRPSGIKAIATETQSTIRVGTLIQPGCDLRKYAAPEIVNPIIYDGAAIERLQTMITMIIITSIIEQMIATKFKISLSRGVKPVLGVLVIFAILPKTVLSPVETTIPMPLPDIQCVP
jgi:hypothetical protein